MTSATTTASETGVLFPTVDGRRSTQTTARAVFADATRGCAPDVARAIDASAKWRRDYVARLVDIEAASAVSPKNALLVAADGLAALHERMVFARDGKEVPVGRAIETWRQPRFETESITGSGIHPGRLAIPYAGHTLTGDELQRQLDRWVADGVIERSCADALRLVADSPDWLDASDLTVALVGAAAEMGPLPALTRWGANVLAVDIRRSDIWDRIRGFAYAGSGTVHLPVDTTKRGTVGADLLTETPEIRAWLDGFDGPLVIGNYAYADGAAFVRVAAAADALVDDLVSTRPGTAVAYLASPTDVFAVPGALVDGHHVRGKRGQLLRLPLRAASAGRLFTPNYRRVVEGEDGQRFGLADSVIPQQGPNYALAKRLQRWRAVVARQSVVTSANVAPATRTRSVMKNRILAAAYNGASSYGVEVFDVETSSTMMAALLIHDLRNPKAAAAPSTPLAHPLDLFVDQSAHGGLWRLPYEPRSVLTLAALEGLVTRR
ncbi:MAG TPA: hypothetical protein VFJ17_06215 [Mycobacteriales bacterium]|jgi:hypothetical protein|nr:hypothetical protein [Mycobacteriales bacterium]